MLTQLWDDLPPERMMRPSSWGETVCRALLGIANKIKIPLSIIFKTKRSVGCFPTQLRAKILHAVLLCALGSKSAGRQYLEEIPDVQECCREGDFLTGVALHSPAILLEWELCFSFPGKYSGFTDCSLDTASSTINAPVACSTVLKRKMIFFFSFLERFIFVAAFAWYCDTE